MKKAFEISIFLSVLAHSFALGAFAAEPVRISLRAQLWTRPLGKESRLKFRPLGDPAPIDAALEPKTDLESQSVRISAKEILATATFLLVPATAKRDAYLSTQVRLYDARTRGLIAECANYDGIRGENGLGVGVCSGVIGPNQYGLTLAKAAR